MIKWSFGTNSLSQRAFTGDTLLRTAAVKEIRFPIWMTAFEDDHIRCQLEEHGYRWVKATDRYYCDHYDFKGPSIGYFAASCAKKMGYLTTTESVVNLIKVFPQSTYAFAKTRYWNLVPYQIKYYVHCVLGAMSSKTNTQLLAV
jgi:hypothetical protein